MSYRSYRGKCPRTITVYCECTCVCCNYLISIISKYYALFNFIYIMISKLIEHCSICTYCISTLCCISICNNIPCYKRCTLYYSGFIIFCYGYIIYYRNKKLFCYRVCCTTLICIIHNYRDSICQRSIISQKSIIIIIQECIGIFYFPCTLIKSINNKLITFICCIFYNYSCCITCYKFSF